MMLVGRGIKARDPGRLKSAVARLSHAELAPSGSVDSALRGDSRRVVGMVMDERGLNQWCCILQYS